MALSAGEKLGPYEIIEPIGKGGMGEVWKARDTRLDRIVAIKTSNQQFTERFEREARAVAALNHPNVCTLHDVGPDYLVMEFVEGVALKGPLPLEEVLRVGRQITSALEAAHEKGITHRDLKPGNILMKPDGTVKVLDFGLAKIGSRTAASGSDPEFSPTISMAATQAGMILGTAAYMAPEQAKGKEVDKRADIWAFGVVLYELTTGSRPFHGDDMTEILASVIREHPSLEPVPHELRRLLKKCLEKDPAKRLRDIGDVWELLEARAEVAQVAAVVVKKGSVAPWAVAALAGIAAIVAIVALWAPWHTPPPAPQVERFEIPPPDKTVFDNPLTLSPDGRHLLFTTPGELWVRSLDTLEARKLAPWTQNPGPFWAHDSRFVAFQQDGKLKKVDIAGGPPTTLSDAPTAFGGGAWNADNVIVFGNRGGPLQQVPSAGGVPVALTKLDEKRSETSHGFPSFLPDQKHFVYLRRSSKAEFTGIYIGQVGVPPEQQDSKILVATGSSAVYTPSPDPREATRGLGFLLFLRDATLMAQPFDAEARELKGEPVPIADQVNTTNYGFGRFSASSNGGLVHATGGGGGTPTQLTWFDRQGKSLGTIGNPGRYRALALAPNGLRVAAEKSDGTATDLWLIDAAPGGKNDRFTFDPARETSPVWSPDGSEIIFASTTGGGVLNLFKKPSNLTGKEEDLFKSPENKNAMDWSRDGKTLSFSPFNPDADVWTLNLSDKKPALFFKSSARDYGGRFSPDGRWLAYTSQVTGSPEVYVRPFPANESGGQQMISLGGGRHPLWKRDGRELYYLSPDNNKVMAVEVTPGPALKFGQPKTLFAYGQQAGTDGPYYQWDVTADGSRFLINLQGAETSQAAPLTWVLNWTAGLK